MVPDGAKSPAHNIFRDHDEEGLQALLKPWSSGPGAGQSRRQAHNADKVICIDRTTLAALGTWRNRHNPDLRRSNGYRRAPTKVFAILLLIASRILRSVAGARAGVQLAKHHTSPALAFLPHLDRTIRQNADRRPDDVPTPEHHASARKSVTLRSDRGGKPELDRHEHHHGHS